MVHFWYTEFQKSLFYLAFKPIKTGPWEAAVKQAELKDFRFHNLRHSSASYLAMNGASLAEIAEVLGHKTLQMVKRYAHLSDQHVAGVVERINKAIFTEPANDNNESVQMKARRRYKLYKLSV